MTKKQLDKLGPEKHLATFRDTEGKFFYQILGGEKDYFFQSKKALFYIRFLDDTQNLAVMTSIGASKGITVYLSEIELIKSNQVVEWFKKKFSKKKPEQLFI